MRLLLHHCHVPVPILQHVGRHTWALFIFFVFYDPSILLASRPARTEVKGMLKYRLFCLEAQNRDVK
jgi:hypothetical protein